MTTIQLIDVKKLKLSTSRSQVERRARYNNDALAELAGSILDVGMLQPLVVRPAAKEGTFEIVAGERRFIAAQGAHLTQVPVNVRELTDEQVLEVQLIENLQREGLHELAEAEGYEALIGMGHNADELATKFGKSKAYVYGRLKLLALSPAARTAFYDGKLTASVALLLARVPTPALQDEALAAMLGGRRGGDWGAGDWDADDEPMNYRQAAAYLHDEFMLQLKNAPFGTDDADLVPAAGPCTTCPKRTGNQPELFGDIQSADVCTDRACFASKRQAFTEQRLAKARQAGQRIIEGAEAKKAVPYSVSASINGFKRLDEKCYADSKSRTYDKILGKRDRPPTALLVDPKDPTQVVEVIDTKALNAVLKAKNIGQRPESQRASGELSRAEIKVEAAFRARLHELVRAESDFGRWRHMFAAVAMHLFEITDHGARQRVVALWGWQEQENPEDDDAGEEIDVDADEDAEISRYENPQTTLVRSKVAAMKEAELDRFFTDLVFVGQLQVNSWGGKPTRLLAEAARRGIDPEAVRKEVVEAAAAKKPRGKKAKEPVAETS